MGGWAIDIGPGLNWVWCEGEANAVLGTVLYTKSLGIPQWLQWFVLLSSQFFKLEEGPFSQPKPSKHGQMKFHWLLATSKLMPRFLCHSQAKWRIDDANALAPLFGDTLARQSECGQIELNSASAVCRSLDHVWILIIGWADFGDNVQNWKKRINKWPQGISNPGWLAHKMKWTKDIKMAQNHIAILQCFTNLHWNLNQRIRLVCANPKRQTVSSAGETGKNKVNG